MRRENAMLETVESTTLLCLFNNDDSASATVHDLLALGLDESSVAVVGNAHTELTGKTPSDTLANTLVLDGSLSRIMDGLDEGGTIVAVQTTDSLSGQVDAIFRRHSAVPVDEKTIDTDHFRQDPRLMYEEPNRLDMIESEENA